MKGLGYKNWGAGAPHPGTPRQDATPPQKVLGFASRINT